MIRKCTRGWMMVATLLGGGIPVAAVAQITGKESVPGGVEARPSAPQMERMAPPAPAPSMPAAARPRAPITAAPPTVGASPPTAAPTAPPADKVAPTPPPPKDAKGTKKKKSSKGGSVGPLIGSQPGLDAARSSKGASQPSSTGGGADERRPGGVERAPGQPQ